MLRSGAPFALVSPAIVAFLCSLHQAAAHAPSRLREHGPGPAFVPRLCTQLTLRLRGGQDQDEYDIKPKPWVDLAPVGPGLKAKFIDNQLLRNGDRLPDMALAEEAVSLDYWRPPVPLDLCKGETKEDLRERLRRSFSNYADEDQFNFLFYERAWPAFKADKRLRAARRNELLAPHLREVFDEDEATNSSWFVPYSEQIRKELGDFPNATAFFQSLIPKSEFKDPTQSPEHALWEACQRGAGDDEIFELAMRVENIDAQDQSHLNWTAAHFAAERGHVQVFEVLAALQADMWLEDAEGNTPGDIAQERSHLRVVDVLEDVFELDAERERKRSDPPDPEPRPGRATDFEKIFLY